MPPESPQRLTRVLARVRSPRFLGWLGGTLLVLLAVRAALPLAIELGAERFGSDLFGRRVEIQDVDLALLAGDLTVEGVAVGPLGRAGEPPPEFAEGEAHFTLATLAANLGWLGLLSGEIHLERVELIDPGWLMLRDASGQLVPVLLPREAVDGEEEEPDEEPAPGPTVRLDALTLTRLDMRFVNMARPDDLPLHFQLAELQLLELVRQGEELAMGGVALREPSVRVLQDIDLSFVTGSPPAADGAEAVDATAAVTPEDAAPVAPPKLRLRELDIETARLLLVTPDGEVETELAFHAEGVTLEPGVRFPIRASVGIEGGELVLEGEGAAIPLAFAGTLTWRELPLDTLAGAAGALSPLLIDSGKSTGALRIDAQLGSEESAHVDVSGRLAVAGLAARDRSGDLSVAWSALDVDLAGLQLDPGGEQAPRVELSNISLAAPRIRAVRRPGAGDAAPPQEPPAAPSEPAAAPEIALARFVLTDGQLELIDETVEPRHRSQVTDLQVTAEALKWPAQEAERVVVSFSGPADARFALEAALGSDSRTAHLELDRLHLPAFSPYAVEASGYWVEAGVLSVEADVAVEGSRTKVDSKLDVLDLDVAEVTPGSFEKQFGVPVDLGLALLKDPRGRIDLPIRVALGDGNSSVDVTAILISALRQAIIGALTAPLKTAGLLLGGDDGPGGMRLAPVPMAAGSAAPSPQDVKELARLVDVLESRPGLSLELHGTFAPEDDPVLAEKILEEQVVADAELPPVDAGFLQRRRLRGALEERAKGGSGELDAEDAEALQRWVARVDVPDARRRQLAERRAENVRDVLIRDHGIDSERVGLGEPSEGAPGVTVGLAPAER